jgi:L-threonylcarbamoyladenylate synthase
MRGSPRGLPGLWDKAQRALARDEVVGYPTDTLYGLAVRPTRRGLERLFALKGRPSGSPVSMTFSSWEEVEPFVRLDARRRADLRERLPGPYTMLLPASDRARRTWPAELFGPRGSLGVRIPDHPLARELARRAGPVTATSANRHGEPPAVTATQARRVLERGVAVYLPAVPRPSGRPSILVDWTRDPPEIRRRPEIGVDRPLG